MMRSILFVLFFIIICGFSSEAQFITNVHEYTPAPGQFINSSPFGAPTVAKNSIIGGVNGSMSLGAFGGYIIFSFENPVQNDPENPYGIDFTVFGNPQKAYGYDRVTWAEPAVVYVMNDANGNGLPDDTWFELAGSDYFFSSTRQNYAVTYMNPNSATNVHWVDNEEQNGLILVNSFHTQPYYPLVDSFPHINADEYTLEGTLIESQIDTTNPAIAISWGRSFGYADNQLRGHAPYTIPDNPYTDEVENSGGDAFDISWAVDSAGNYIDLDEIHFVKVMCCTQSSFGVVGEISTEIMGAVDVEPNATITGELDRLVIKPLPRTISNPQLMEVFAFHAGRLDSDAAIAWESSLDGVEVDQNNMLTFTTSGSLTLTARLVDRPQIQSSISVILSSGTNTDAVKISDIQLYPNPTSDYFAIKGVNCVMLRVFNSSGSLLLQNEDYCGAKISVSHFLKGIYIAEIQGDGAIVRRKFVVL